MKNLLKLFFIGKAKDPKDSHIFAHLSLVAFLAWVGLGADGLSSSCYGPEEAFLALGNHYYLGIFVAIASGLTVLIISISYIQIIELFPHGGGGYLVASKLLSPKVGMVSGSALLIDYVLTITISIASGADAIFSFLPKNFLPYKLVFAVVGLALLILLNLRGIKEAVLPLVPIFITFVVLHLFAIVYSITTHLYNFSTVYSNTKAEVGNSISELGILGVIFLILKAYSMGAGTFTGIEAVSNGLPVLRDPKVVTGRKTMIYMAASLSITVIGLMLSYLLFQVKHVPGKTLNAVLFDTMSINWGTSYSTIFIFAILLSEAILLFIAAQAGFLDGPRVLASMASDRWFPTRFAMLSDRLVTQNGVILMGVSAFVMMILTTGSVKLLVILYSINVFITFTLSQLGMVIHWWKRRKIEKVLNKILINGLGLFITTFILITVVVIKFEEGGWITILITSGLVLFGLRIKAHYNKTAKMFKTLDDLVPSVDANMYDNFFQNNSPEEIKPTDKTAILLVNGYNGLGLHSLLSLFKMFGTTFKNYIFVSVGVVDAGNFKGAEEVEGLENHISKEADKYVNFMKKNGFNAEKFTSIGIDVVEEIEKVIPQINAKYKNTIFFGGQVVFPKETYFTKWLHNYIVFAVQKKLYQLGIPFVILPIRL